MPKREIQKERNVSCVAAKKKKDIEHYMMGNYWRNGHLKLYPILYTLCLMNALFILPLLYTHNYPILQ